MRPGDLVGARYRLVEPLAAGGMGTLWRAHHVELDVDVALKVVSSNAVSAGALKRFRREAQAAAKLRSPHIVQMLDYGELDGQPYLTMELLRGEDLSERLRRVGKLSCQDSATILDAVAKAVTLAHEAGIVHRDLKPANVFLQRVGEEEVVKVLDFGVAKDLAAPSEPASTTAAGVVGSPAYMSPEQVWGEPVSTRSDLWAMGVLAFEMLTGKNPFADETLARTFERIVRDPLPMVTSSASHLPQAIDAFFEHALARAPDARFASAKELVLAFRHAIAGRAAPARGKPRRSAVWVCSLFALGAIGLMVAASKRGAPPSLAERSVPRPSPPLPNPTHEGRAASSNDPPRALDGRVAPMAPSRLPSRPSASGRPGRSSPGPSASAARSPALDPRFGIPLVR